MQDILRRKLSIVDGTTIPDDAATTKKKFIIRLVSALHGAGNLTFRTEKLIGRVSNHIGLHCTCTILPNRVIISFQEDLVLNPTKSESYTFSLPSGWSVHKLCLLEQLCFDVSMRGKSSLPFSDANEKLEFIEHLPALYSKYTLGAVYFTASLSSALLFYECNGIEACWAGLFGALIFVIENASARLAGLGEVVAFISAFSISALATALDLGVYKGELCLFGTMYGGVVWLLPGLTITIALLEIYSGMIVYGSSRLVYGISTASQVGFGLALGRLLIAENETVPESFTRGCREPIPVAYGFLLLPIAATAFAMMLQSGRAQLPGMVATAAVGQFASFWLMRYNMSPSITPFLCSMLVTTTARLWAWVNGNERPLVYIISGLIILVPGGVGVKGMFRTTLNGDPLAGMQFTYSMVMIGITLAIGVFVSLVPTTKWFIGKHHGKHDSDMQSRRGNYHVAESDAVCRGIHGGNAHGSTVPSPYAESYLDSPHRNAADAEQSEMDADSGDETVGRAGWNSFRMGGKRSTGMKGMGDSLRPVSSYSPVVTNPIHTFLYSASYSGAASRHHSVSMASAGSESSNVSAAESAL